MKRRTASAVIALTLTPALIGLTATSSDAASRYYYSSCTKLTKVFPHGVAKSAAAAAKQVRAGNSRPAYGTKAKKVYWENRSRLDRDKDGTACER